MNERMIQVEQLKQSRLFSIGDRCKSLSSLFQQLVRTREQRNAFAQRTGVELQFGPAGIRFSVPGEQHRSHYLLSKTLTSEEDVQGVVTLSTQMPYTDPESGERYLSNPFTIEWGARRYMETNPAYLHPEAVEIILSDMNSVSNDLMNFRFKR